MKRSEVEKRLKQLKLEMLAIRDEIDCLIAWMMVEDSNDRGTEQFFERTISLNSNTSKMKGGKAVSVTYKNETQHTKTWKSVYECALKICNKYPKYHYALMNNREKVMGRDRTILSASGEGMDKPIKIDEELYAESYFDTNMLLYVLKKLIFEPIGFDYSDISITYRPQA